MDLKKIYQERVLDHYNHPRHTQALEQVDMSSGVFNPSCGDSVHIEGTVTNGVLTHARFSAKGCVISCAAASMLLEHAINTTIAQIEALTPSMMQKMVSIPLGPTRLRCALLPLEALQNALRDYQKK